MINTMRCKRLHGVSGSVGTVASSLMSTREVPFGFGQAEKSVG